MSEVSQSQTGDLLHRWAICRLNDNKKRVAYY